MSKKKMSNKRFRLVLIPITSILLVTAIVATIVMNFFSVTMDVYLGRGGRHVSNVEGSQNWDTSYYKQYATPAEALNAALDTSADIAREGIVLLKNDGILPLSRETAITPMGYRYVEPLYGGTGSGGMDTSKDYVVTAKAGLENAFSNVNDAVENAMNAAKVNITDPKGTVITDGDNYSGASTSLLEYKSDVYENAANAMQGTVGLVFIGRVGGEGADLCATEYADGTKHELALTVDEKAMIEIAKQNCENVIIVVETSNAMELAELEDDAGINGILLVGGMGSAGFTALGEVLNGTVNPSGRLVDIYVADLTADPTYVNFDRNDGQMNYSNSKLLVTGGPFAGQEKEIPFHEYEEGVYLGYKYYETSSSLNFFTSNNLPEGVTDPYCNRDNGVVYPFGYGLSYTTFTQEITDFRGNENTVELTVRVTNTGSAAGKDVVEVYYNPPYTDFDIEYKIEKPTVNLIAFDKTDVLEPGAYQDITIQIDTEDMASYCFTRDNGDGTTGCYVLENGTYEVSIRSDSHTVLDTKTFELNNTVWFDNSNPRQSEKDAQSALDNDGNPLGYPEKTVIDADAEFVAATNQFEKGNQYMTDSAVGGATILSRADWAGTQPTAPTDADRQASEQVIAWNTWNNASFDPESDEKLGNDPSSPVYASDVPPSNGDNGLTLADLRGKSYYDESWDLLLDQLDYSATGELSEAVFHYSYATGPLASVGKPATADKDGPQGITQMDTGGNNWTAFDTCSYVSEPVVAQTWNVDCAYDFGWSVGQEALSVEVNGWYAPGVNIHRSAFSGRNFEYYSEDSYMTGMMAAAVVSGAGDGGLYCTVKHFAFNDQEAQRDTYLAVWATEQCMRETYLKAGELLAKNARKTITYIADENGTAATKTMRAADSFMAGFAAPAGEYNGWNYGLMENVIRGEWGFQGFITTDMCGLNGSAVDKLIRGGGDVLMSFMPDAVPADMTSATGLTQLRESIKNLLYVQANSSVTNHAAPGAVIYYDMSPWRIALTAADIAVGAWVVISVVWIVLRQKDEKRNPEKYSK